MTITDPSRASTPTQGPSATPLPTNPRSLNIRDSLELEVLAGEGLLEGVDELGASIPQ